MPGHDSDPIAWSVHTRAPPGETPQERAARLEYEAEAKKRSDAIDEELRRDREKTKREAKGTVKVLLLGQSESGKSTTLKNFRMQHSRAEWDAELKAWRAVIQLNLLKSVITILDALQAEQDGDRDGDPYSTFTADSGIPYTPSNAYTSSPTATTAYAANGYHTPTTSPTVGPSGSYNAVPGSSSNGGGYANTIGPSTSRSRSISQPQQPPQPFRSLGATSGSAALRQTQQGLMGDSTTSIQSSSSRSRNNSSSSSNYPSRIQTTTIDVLPPPPLPTLAGKQQLLKLRLAPLRSVEQDLRRRLGAGAEEDYGNGMNDGVLGDVTNSSHGHDGLGPGMNGMTVKRKTTREFSVRRVQDVLDSGVVGASSNTGHGFHGHAGSKNGHINGNGYAVGKKREEDVDEATEVIASCRDDIKELWSDDIVRGILRRRRIRLEDGGGFFLDDVERIASRTYTPSSDDVVRARLRTLGVQEYRIKVDPNSNGEALGKNGKGQSASRSLMKNVASQVLNFGNEWLLYDVGGSRTGRHAWIPFFEGVNAIIFLAPLSCFDERLLEDPRVNRLEDSFLLWRTVCNSPLLQNASLILFMNKCDLLKRKLKKGAQIKDYLPSYGDRPNDMATVVRYLKDKFRDLAKSNTRANRTAYYYATSVTDTKTTAMTLAAVKDIILREHLKNADFM